MSEVKPKRILVDGRVFSTGAAERGMGRYVTHVLTSLDRSLNEVTILLFKNVQLSSNSQQLRNFDLSYVAMDPSISHTLGVDGMLAEMHQFSAELSRIIEEGRFDLYIDATPFLPPLRLDVLPCPVVSICYDFIPLKHPEFYLGADVNRVQYSNGLARVAKADSVICISQTTADETNLLLGVPRKRLIVVYPDLDDYYQSAGRKSNIVRDGGFVFSIVGAHKSKNPHQSAAILENICSQKLRLHVNVPSADQKSLIAINVRFPKSAKITTEISEAEKHSLQRDAVCVAHLSMEEGFGIPFLEALFLGTKVLALDIPINREIVSLSAASHAGCVHFIAPQSGWVDSEAFREFIESPSNEFFFDSIRGFFLRHWSDASALVQRSIELARERFETWNDKLFAKVFSSIPGQACGVADYTMAYLRSVPDNFVLFYSSGTPEQVSYLNNVKVASHLDFARFSKGKFSRTAALYNLAFSPALFPGILFMRQFAKPGDAILIHERYFYEHGLMPMLAGAGKVDEFFPPEDSRPSITEPRVEWLTELGAKLVSHLPPSILAQMRSEQRKVSWRINDLESIEGDIEYIPLGIDDRQNPAVGRRSRAIRIRRGLTNNDLLIGHFGLVIDDLKRLGDVVDGFLKFAKEQRDASPNRVVLFALVGKVVDEAFFQHIRKQFEDCGLAHRLVHQAPAREQDFDAEIAACDAIFCMRRQRRGQVSHVFVRALSLGVPVLVNKDSGYSYDPDTTIDDDRIDQSIPETLSMLLDPSARDRMRRVARVQYETVHRAEISLASMLDERR